MLPGGIVADIVNGNRDQTRLNGPLDDALSEHAVEQTRKQRQDIEPHVHPLPGG